MPARLIAFLMWSLLAGTAVFWLLRVVVRPDPVADYALQAEPAAAPAGDLARLFGEPEAAPAAREHAPSAPSRYRLAGVMAPRADDGPARAAGGVALIAIDDKPVRAYRIGQRIDGDVVLRQVGWRTATLGNEAGASTVVIELPPPPPPATGVPVRSAEADIVRPVAPPDAAERAARRVRRGRAPPAAAGAAPPESAQAAQTVEAAASAPTQ